MTQYGAVVVFKPGVSRGDAERAMAALASSGQVESGVQYDADANRFVKLSAPAVNEFDGERGGPVWYIP
jgi:hypothetical protein